MAPRQTEDMKRQSAREREATCLQQQHTDTTILVELMSYPIVSSAEKMQIATVYHLRPGIRSHMLAHH